MKPPVLRIHVRAVVKPTEDPAKVRRALVALFPGAEVEDREGWLYAEAKDLARLKELIRSEQIQDTARGVMLAGLLADGMGTTFRLGKQAAAAGRLHFGPLRSPLGDVEVTITGTGTHEVERLLYHLAPDTCVAPEWAEVPDHLRPQDAA
jgi:predicted RNA binding protein with dsRBD fold (UPF0201 family)